MEYFLKNQKKKKIISTSAQRQPDLKKVMAACVYPGKYLFKQFSIKSDLLIAKTNKFDSTDFNIEAERNVYFQTMENHSN